MMQRRNFLKLTGVAGGGMLLSTSLPISKLMANTTKGNWEPNFYIRITPDNVITLISSQLEIGQGTTVGLMQILADELGADWDAMQLELADGDEKKYGDLQDTGGSNGLANLWLPIRKAGAATRSVLVESAAKRWSIAQKDCVVQNSYVYHPYGKQKLSFGELANEASQLKIPEDPQLLPEAKFKMIGKPVAGHKQKQIVTGTHGYSLDIKLPGMVYAVIARTPVVQGKVKSFDDTATRKVKGVLEVFKIDGNPQQNDWVFKGGVRSGVVVVADSNWAAMQGKKQLKIQWDEGELANQGTDTSYQHFLEEVNKPHKPSSETGDAKTVLAEAKSTIVADYFNDYQVNACMEPLNAVADFKGDSVEIWAGTQAPQLNRARISELLEWDIEKVTVHPRPSGGGFGRRYYCDYIEEAVIISKEIRKPVKLMWTREDTIQTNRYHDFRLEHWHGVLENKKLVAFDYRGIVGASGGYRPFPYDIPNQIFSRMPSKRPYVNLYTSWRSVGAHMWIWGLESYMDELAHAADVDPVEFRLNHLNDEKIIAQKGQWTREDLYPGRLKTALNLVTKKGNWGRKMPKGSGQGIAVCSYNTSYCALLVEVTVQDQKFKIDRAVAAIDCGKAINPSQVKSQIEGSVVWGMSALTQKIDIVNGRTKQSNFHNYPLPKNSEVPDVEVHIIENNFAPSGTGEPGVPVVAPAVANAIFAATGKRLRRIPFDLSQLS